MYKLLIDFSTDVFLQNLQDCGKILRSQFLEYSIFEITVKISRFILIFIEYDSFLIDFSTFSQLTYFYKTCIILLRKNSSITASRLWYISFLSWSISRLFLNWRIFTKLARFYCEKILRSQLLDCDVQVLSWSISRLFLNWRIFTKILRS